MATVISQMGQQATGLPFFEVAIDGKKYIMGCDGANVMVFKPRSWISNGFGASDTVANGYENATSAALISALSLNASNATTLDGRFPAAASLGDGYKLVEGFNMQTGWAAGFPTNSKTVGTTTGTTTTTTTTGSTTSGTTSGSSTADTPVVQAAPTATEQISSYLSTYWWAVLLIAVALLWKPVIAPALGIKSSRRNRR